MTRFHLHILLLLLAGLLASARPQNNGDVYDDDNNEVGENDGDIEVQDIPDFVSESGSVHVAPGRILRLTCQLNNINEDIPLRWTKGKEWLYLNQRAMMKDTRINVRTIEGGQGEILTINDAQESDAGLYQCSIMAQEPKTIEFEVSVGDEDEDEDENDDDSEDDGDAEPETGQVGDGNGGSAIAQPVSMAFLLSVLVPVILFQCSQWW